LIAPDFENFYMTDTTAVSPAPRRRHGLLRVLLWIAAAFLVLIVTAYLVGTSAAFLKGFILPRVSKAVNAEITVSDAAIHPFSAVTLHNLKVTPKGRETLLTAPEVRARYTLLDIVRGNINVDEVVITSPTIHLVENPDGTSNLDPLLEGSSKDKDKEPKEKQSKPPQLNIRQLSLSNATLRKEKLYVGGNRDVMEISKLNLALSNLKNGDSGKLTLSANALVQNNPPAPTQAGNLEAVANGEYIFALSADLKPLSVKGETLLKVSRADGSMADLNALAVTLGADVAPNEIKELALRFKNGEEPLGELRVAGPFDMEKTEGRLKIELLSLDKRALNLIGAKSGIDFGTTKINSTNEIQLAARGQSISVAGRFSIAQLQLLQTNQTTPTLDLNADYNVTIDTGASNALVRTLNVIGTQSGKPLLATELTSPMTIAWGSADASVGDSVLNVTVANLNLADWKPFLGDSVSQGIVNLKTRILSQQSGKKVTVNLASDLANIVPIGGDKQLNSANITGDISLLFGTDDSKTIQGGIQFSNIVLHDPSGTVPATPLAARLQVDTTLGKEIVDLRQLQLTLTPTQRAKNELQLQGRVDLSDTNATQGNLKLTAESLDVTAYYDLFTANTNPVTAAKPSQSGGTPSQPAPSKPEHEPDAVHLPFRNFVAEANIGRFYLREVEITNLVTSVKVDGGHVVLNPLQLSLNGAPVNGNVDLDLGVPGYRYTVQLDANRIPVAPLANSFAPSYRGKAQGDLIAKLNIKGAGTTGVNLQKNLGGTANLVFTNANIQLVGSKMRAILVPITLALRVPELADSPVNLLVADIDAGNGKIDISQFRAAGTAFAASSMGTITIASVLTNSPINNLPVNFSLGRSLAARAGFKGSADTNNAYVDLGTIAHVKGTVGKPDPKVDYARIALLTGQQFIGGTAGEVLRGVGGVTTGTNGAVNNLIKGIGGILGGKPSTPANASAPTNAPPTTNTPPATNTSPLDGVLQLLGPKAK
jgi:uncharacterized protein involved in outer membrane biogenesis